MMNKTTHKIARVAFEEVVDRTVDYIDKDREKNLLRILHLSEKFAGDLFDPQSFLGAKKIIQDPTNKWNQYANHILDVVDPNVIKTMAMNLGFEAAFYGNGLNHIKREEYGCNIPWVILMDPTSACNMKCKGCWAAEYGNRSNLSLEEMDSVITQGKELGVYFYMMTGGEPLVRKNDVIALARKHSDCVFNIFTNGTLIDEPFIETVKELGNITFSISVEGFEEVNDSRRGDGCFDTVTHAMKIMKDNGIAFGTSICYTKYNIETVTSDAFLNFLIEQGVLFTWYFHYMPVGVNADADLLPTIEQREYILHRVRYIRSSESPFMLYAIDFQNDGEYIGGCIAGGRHYFHINANGDIEPCVFIHYSDANIREDTLIEALQKPLFRAYQSNQPFNDNHLRPCPMLENPEYLEKMIRDTHAASTDLEAPETAHHLCEKCVSYAEHWAPKAEQLWNKPHEDLKIG